MSTRIRTDGRRYDPATDLDIRPYHKPIPVADPMKPNWRCAVCGEPWGWVTRGGRYFRRHYPGTFWERD